MLKKKGFGNKLVGFLFSDKLDSIGTYLLHSILEPGINALFYNAVVGAAGMFFNRNGGYSPPNSAQFYNPGVYQSSAQRSPYPYNMVGYSQAYPQQVQQAAQNQNAGMQRSAEDEIKRLSWQFRDDVQTVIDRMAVRIQRYGRATVADLYRESDLTPDPGNWTLSACGWYSMEGAQPIPGNNGYWYISLPPVQRIG